MLPQATATAAGVLGDLPWGTHFCYFFESPQDLFATVVPFLQQGLENHEFCLWSIYTPITEAEALEALRESIPDLDRYLAEGAIEIQVNPEPQYSGDVLKAHQTVGLLRNLLDGALERGFSGLRVAGSPTCIQRGNTEHFREFEREMARTLEDRRIIALCYFSLPESGAGEILDAARMHQFVAARRGGTWEIVEASEIKPPSAELPERTPRPAAELGAIGRRKGSFWSFSKIAGALAGTLAMLLGAAAALGWAIHSTFLTQMLPNLPAMDPLAAIGLMLSALAFLGIVRDRARLTFAGSGVTAVLALASFSHPAWMTSATAACFIVLAAGCVLAHIGPLATRPPALGISGWLVAAAGAICGIAALWGSGDAFGLGVLIRMAPQSAAGFELLGLGAVTVAVGMSNAGLRQPVWASIGAGFFLAAIRISLLQAFSPKNLNTTSSALAFLGAMLGAVVFGVVVHLALKAHRQRELLGTVNQRLQEEMVVRSQAQEEAHLANERLERRVEERTEALGAVNAELRKEIAWRERVEEDLRRQKEILQSIVDHVPLILKFVDKDGRIQMVNHEWERVLGRTLDEIVNQGVDIYAEGYPDLSERGRLLEFVANSSGEWADFKTRVKDGRVIDTSWAVARLSDGATICIGQDISERKQAERELRRQKELLQTIFDHIPVMINFGDENFELQLVNREWERVLGWSCEEIRGDNVDILAENYPDPEQREQARDFVMHSHGEWRDFKTKVRDGRVIDTSWVMLHLPDGTSIGIGQDISERKRAEEELRKQKELLQTIFDHIPVMVGFVDQKGRPRVVNREWERTLGWPLEEIQRRDIDIIDENYPDPEYRAKVRDFIENSDAEWVDFKTTVRDGRVIETSWAMLRLSDGSAIGIGQDITKRKQAEQELRKQKEILQTIFDHLPVMINFVDQNNKLQLVNREWERTLGWTLEEVHSQNIDILVENYPDPEYRKMVRDFIVNSHGEWADFKTTVRDGRVIDASWAMLQLSDGTGIGIGQDITKRKRAEEALRESEERFRQLAENITDLFWIKTPDFKRVLYLSPVYERMSGRTAEQRYLDDDYQPFLELIHPEDREKMAQIMRQGAGEEFDVEFRIFRPDGSWGWIRDRGFPIRDQTGQIYRIAGIANDITERKLAEEALRESEERFRQLTENIREVFWLRSPDFKRLLYVSPIYEKVCGKSHDDIYATGVDLEVVHPEDRSRIIETMQNFGGREFEIEYRIIGKEGEVRWLRDRGFPIRNESGEIYRVGGVAEDITDRKEADDRLRAKREQLRALSASLQSAQEKEATRIAHQIHDEMGGILTGLRWELEALAKMIDEPAGAERLKVMRDKLATMLGLTDTTINVVRRIASELRPSILDDLGLMEAIEWQTQQFQARTGIQCRCDCSLQSIPLGDQESTAVFRIVQEALTNILRHAQATEVRVAMHEEDGTFELTVIDNGSGITTGEKLSRNSLGLLGMQERAHLIGGNVEIAGRPGMGTTLHIRVPLARAASGGVI